MEHRHRPELQGLRALAVLLVVVYHVWLGRVSGGVDVFFVLTGFLITGQLFRAAGRGPIAFRPLWSRMVRRLFPAATTVLLVTTAAAVLLLPQTRWLQTIREIAAAALYVENWALATDPEPPYQHIPDLPGNVTFLDFSDYYCTADVCPPVVGNVLVYLDHNHTSATFMATLSPIAERMIHQLLAW